MHIPSLPTVIRFALGAVLFFSILPAKAQTLTWQTWDPYTDCYGLINSELVTTPKTGLPSTNNGPLYTAEACVIMELKKVPYDRNAIAAAIARCQVQKGLYEHSPWDAQDMDTQDDYIGLGALAGVCGFHDIARDILEYGNGGGQVLPSTILGLDLNPVDNLKGLFGLFRQGLRTMQSGSLVPYVYNNLNPGTFTMDSWMGKYLGMIVHWKIAAGEVPTKTEFVIWSAALELSARTNMGTDAERDPWLQSWLMVLTYEMSGLRSAVADRAVENWWKLLYQRWPGGMKQVMIHSLIHAVGSPFSEFIEDFKEARAPSVHVVDADGPEDALVSAVEGLLANFSPKDFLAPFSQGLSNARDGLDLAQKALDVHKKILAALPDPVAQATKDADDIAHSLADLTRRRNEAANQVITFVSQRAGMLTKGLDKIIPGGHWEISLLTPPPGIWVPDALVPNPTFVSLEKLITSQQALVANLDNLIANFGTTQTVLKQNIAAMHRADELIAINLVTDALNKARAILDKAQGAMDIAQSVVYNLIPGVPLQPADYQ